MTRRSLIHEKTTLSIPVLNNSPMSNVEKSIYLALLFLGTFFFVRYFVWWIQPQHIPSNTFPHFFIHINTFIFIVLTFVMFFGSFLKIGTWLTILFMKRPKHVHPTAGIKTAFVTCYVPGKEPLSMLRETVLAMRDADYPHDTWVLDEGNELEVKQLCKELGILHFSRNGKVKYNQKTGHFKAKTKAGNLNAWRDTYEHYYDVVAQVDMDHKPHKDYLTKQLGYFSDPKVGYVVTPQIYKNTGNWIARGAAEQTHYYYGPLQQGLYGAHMPYLIGTTHLYRVTAMKGFGGYAPSIAEDFLTSMHFSSSGWKGVYVPEILAEGDGPTSWTDYFNQQMRWSYGLYDILFKHTHKHVRALTNKQKVNLYLSSLFYFSGIASFIGFILTSLYLAFGINAANMSVGEWFYYAIPAYGGSILIVLFLHRFYIDPKNEPAIGLYGSLLAQAATVIYTVAFVNFIFRRKLTYKVTAKGESSEDATSLQTLQAHIFMLCVSFVTLLMSFLMDHSSWVMRFWAGLNILTVTGLITAIFWNKIKSQYVAYRYVYAKKAFMGVLLLVLLSLIGNLYGVTFMDKELFFSLDDMQLISTAITTDFLLVK